MHRTRSISLAVLAFAAVSAHANSVANIHPDDEIENPKTYSRNHRFCFVERLDSRVPDFGSVRASSLYDFDEEGYRIDERESSGPTVGVLYEGKRAVAMLPAFWIDGYVLVSDSGRFVVHVGLAGHEPFVTIDRTDGSPRVSLHENNVLSASDRAALLSEYFYLQPRLEIVDDREFLVLQVPTIDSSGPHADVRIDLQTGARLGELEDLYPVLRAWPSPSDGAIPAARRSRWEPMKCSIALQREPVLIASKQLYARATRRGLATFPEIAGKVRIEGMVWMEVTVDETGHVVCTRTNGLPFGIIAAAEKAMRQWTFEPYILDGRAVPVTSEIAWHFRRVPQEEWKEIAAGF